METTRDITTTIDNQRLVLTFRHGKTINLGASDLSDEIVAIATLHGLKQKLVDAAAISRNPDTGATSTIEDKYQAVYEVYNRLMNGEWNKTREAGSGGGGGLLFRALVRLYPRKTADELRTFIGGLDKSAQAKLRANPKVAVVIDEIRAESVNDDIDTDELLGELDD